MRHSRARAAPGIRRRYLAKLKARPDVVEELRPAANANPVTLVDAARDEAHNDAVVLNELLSSDATAN